MCHRLLPPGADPSRCRHGGLDGRNAARDAVRSEARAGSQSSNSKSGTGARQAALGKVADATGVDANKLADAAEGRGPTGDRLRDTTAAVGKEVATQAASKGLTSVGVPPQLTEKVLRSRVGQKVLDRAVGKPADAVVRTVRVVAYSLGVSALVVTLLLSSTVVGSFGGTEDQAYRPSPSDEALTDIPKSYIDAYKAAGNRFKVPWTLLAGLGSLASDHGRSNPYQGARSFTGAPATKPSEVVVVGDSLTVGIEPRIEPLMQARGLVVRTDARVGRGTTEGASRLPALTPLPGSAVVVALGTNDSPGPGFDAQIDAVMRATGGAQRVYWVNVDAAGKDGMNDQLNSARSRWPSLTVLDWAGFVRGHPEWKEADGIHLTGDGYQARAQWITDAVANGSTSTGAPVAGPTAQTATQDVPPGGCPRTTPAIGGARGQGAGALLVRPDRLVAHDLPEVSVAELQDICTSADLVAQRIADVRDEVLTEQGTTLAALIGSAKDTADDAESDLQRFWATVINRLDLVADPDGTLATCARPGPLPDAATYTAQLIEAIWRCEAGTSAYVAQLTSDGTITAEAFVAESLRHQGAAYTQAQGKRTWPASVDNPPSFDCSGFIQYILRRLGSDQYYDLSNTQYNISAKAGLAISLEEARRTPGALLFRRGVGSDGHVAISLGNGDTMEAANSRLGTLRIVGGANRSSFNAAALVPGVRYGIPTAAPVAGPTPAPTPEAGTDAHHVVAATRGPDGKVSFTAASAPTGRIVSEALQAAWSWSQWGAAPCDPNAPLAGVFPLDAATFERFRQPGVAGDRCSPEANIAAAAAAFMSVERTVPASRDAAAGPFAPMFGGWSTMPEVLGPTAAAVATNGPRTSWSMPDTCRTELSATVSAKAESDAEPTDAFLDAGTTDLLASPTCAGPGQPSANQAHLALAMIAHSLGTGLVDEADTPGDTATADRATRLERYSARWRERAAASAPEPARAGRDALVSRLGAEERTWSHPTYAAFAGPPITAAYGNKVVDESLRYGGLYAGDTAKPRNVGAGAGGVGITIEVSTEFDGQVVATSDDPALTDLDGRCAPAGRNRGRPLLAERFNRMCNEAQTAGIPLTVTSAHRTMAQQTALKASKGGWAAAPGRSRHQFGTAVDMDQTSAAGPWLHNIVGCYERGSNSYHAFGAEVDYRGFANAVRSGAATVSDTAGGSQSTCPGQIPIKRIQTYGMIFNLCGQRSPEDLRNPDVIDCRPRLAGGLVENWHAQPGVITLTAGGPGALDVTACGFDPATPNRFGNVTADVNNPQTLAALTYAVFSCLSREAGLDRLPPTANSNGTGPQVFANKAQQVAAEAVVVGYCESGYTAKNATGDNFTGTYGGVFQMGYSEADKFIPGGRAAKFDPVPNVIGAARYYLAAHGKNRWDGWGPWAVVNTDYGQVSYPVIPRFSGPRGSVGGSLPPWALDPVSAWAPPGGCTAVQRDGGPWR